MKVTLKTLAMGLLSYVPGAWKRLSQGPNDTDPLRSYGIALKHLSLVRQHGSPHPRSVVELGCGKTLEAGVVLLLLGSARYVGLDALDYLERHTDTDATVDALVELLRMKTPLPNLKGFPDLTAAVGSTGFPHFITDQQLRDGLAPQRVRAIKAALRAASETGHGIADGVTISYIAPWERKERELTHSADLLFSHVVMQHVADPVGVYDALSRMVREGGVMSHQIDYTCMSTSDTWYGHWTWSEAQARFIMGRRPFMINRWAHSHHARQLRESGFNVLTEVPRLVEEAAPREEVALQHLTDSDLRTAGGVFVAARAKQVNVALASRRAISAETV
jgi:SAM-dependent methyltransferase